MEISFLDSVTAIIVALIGLAQVKQTRYRKKREKDDLKRKEREDDLLDLDLVRSKIQFAVMDLSLMIAKALKGQQLNGDVEAAEERVKKHRKEYNTLEAQIVEKHVRRTQ